MRFYKTIYLIHLLLLGIISSTTAQPTSYGSFKVSDQEIVYQKIFFQDGITASKLAEYYKGLPYISNVEVSGDDLNFNVNEITVDYKKFQFTQVGTPSIIQTGKYSGEVVIGVKDGKYRLTMHNIQLTGDIGYKKIAAKDNLTNYACRNNGTYIAQDWCRPNMLGLLDQALTDKLQYVEKEKKKDDGDW